MHQQAPGEPWQHPRQAWRLVGGSRPETGAELGLYMDWLVRARWRDGPAPPATDPHIAGAHTLTQQPHQTGHKVQTAKKYVAVSSKSLTLPKDPQNLLYPFLQQTNSLS